MDSTVYGNGDPVTVTDQGTLVRADWSFIEWNTAADGSGTPHAAGSSFFIGTADIILYAHWVQNNTMNITFTMNPSYGAIFFSSSTVSVERGTPLVLSALPPFAPLATDWHWYVDNAEQVGQTTSTLTWDTAGKQPGQYMINADAVYGGYACTGSIRVTVTY